MDTSGTVLDSNANVVNYKHNGFEILDKRTAGNTGVWRYRRTLTVVTREWVAVTKAAAYAFLDCRAADTTDSAIYDAKETNRLLGSASVVQEDVVRGVWVYTGFVANTTTTTTTAAP